MLSTVNLVSVDGRDALSIFLPHKLIEIPAWTVRGRPPGRAIVAGQPLGIQEHQPGMAVEIQWAKRGKLDVREHARERPVTQLARKLRDERV